MNPTTIRAAQIGELPPSEELAPYASWAIEHGEPFRYVDLMLVPDSVMLAFLANEHELPQTMRLERGDGRSVSIFYVIGDLGYGIAPMGDS